MWWYLVWAGTGYLATWPLWQLEIWKRINWPEPIVGPDGPFLSARNVNPGLTRVVGAVFGVIGGFALNRAFVGTSQFPVDSLPAVIVTVIGAAIFGGVAADLATFVGAKTAPASVTTAR